MKLLLTVDPEIPVPPNGYGGIERIIDSLIRAFAQLGHRVALVANRESSNEAAAEIFGWPGRRSEGSVNIWNNASFLKRVVKAENPDIIHSFSRLLYLYPLFFTRNAPPLLQSYQRKINKRSTHYASLIAGDSLRFTSCANHMIKGHSIASKCTPIYNFTDSQYFTPDYTASKDHLLFLGRIEDLKGTREAVEVALRCQKKLVIAGNIQPGHQDYFDEFINPHLTDPLIEYVGTVNDAQKRELLQNSEALLFPIKWDEPFGIVMAEALACGVPVIGFNRGSVPEVIRDGETGFIVENCDQMVMAVNRLHEIDRKTVRQDCKARFSVEVVAGQYLDLYRDILKK